MRRTLGGVGEHIGGCDVKRNVAGEPHAPACMGTESEYRRTRRVRRKTLGGVGEHIDRREVR